MKTILVPLDLSAASSRVCDAACALAKSTGARLVLLHAVQPPFIGSNAYYAFDAAMVAEGMAAAEAEAGRRLQTFARACAKKHVPVRTAQLADEPAPAILAQATATKARYIVIGSHGHGAMFDLAFGSTTHVVLRRAKCPVLVVPIART